MHSLQESPRASPRRHGAALSIEWKLPLLITGVLAGGLAAFLAFTYVTIGRRAEAVVRDRFVHASRIVAASVASGVQDRVAILDSTARQAAVQALLTTATASSGDSTAARSALSHALGRDALPVMLTDVAGRVLLRAGSPLPPGIPMIAPDAIPAGTSDGPLATARIGPLTAVGDRVMFWVAVPVVVNDRVRGFIMHPRWVTGPPTATETLRELTREDLSVFMRNDDGTGWTRPPGTVAAPPLAREVTSSGLWYERPTRGRVLAEEAEVPGTPWLIVIDSPTGTLLARLRETVTQLALMSVLLLIAGASLAWVMGRRITRPLVSLTAAAEQLATGTYHRSVTATGRDEIGRLETSFHAMAEQVTGARRELEQRASDAQQAAAALTATNQRLQAAMTEAEAARAEAERARAEAEAANRAKSDFLAMMSHELRTPLNAIGGYAELIELGIHGPVTDAQREALTRIARSQSHLLTLINDVLNFARIDARQMTYAVHDVPMNDTLTGLEALVAPQMAARRLTFVYEPCDPSVVATADRDKVRQVVLNLLANAVKYTPEGGVVRLSCDSHGATVRVHIRDTGPGIEPERLSGIFEPFVQGHRALNRPNEGVGLGLAISRDLARGMHGDVTVASTLGAGSTFTLHLPLARRSVPTVPAPRSASPSAVTR